MDALTLDHVGVIVRDLAAGAARWERLGFTLAPISRQRGAVPGQEGMHPWATANRCVILRRGYLELIGTVDASAFNPWQRFLDRFEGIHLLALRCANAGDAYAALAPGALFLEPPVVRERRLMADGVERTMRFRNIFSRDRDCPEGRYIVIEHQTPELLWQDSLMTHANGAIALKACTVVADDSGVAQRLSALGSVPALSTPSEFERRYGWRIPAPAFGAITVSFADLAHAVDFITRQGITVYGSGAERWLSPMDVNGCVMRLVQHVQDG